jgi:UDP-N-acetylglucosamine acyltransferase
MASIHPTALVDSRAEVGADVEIGPYCLVGPQVSIAEGCRLVGHVHITGHTCIGAHTVIYPFASLGGPPQSTNYRGGATRLTIGAKCDIRETVTINVGTEDGGGLTQVGDACFLMAGAHVAHDCKVGNNVTFANNATLGGHVSIGDRTFLGGNSAVHQFVRVGEGVMIGGLSGVRGDIIPFGMALGQVAGLVGLNIVGLKRSGYSRSDMHILRSAYRILFGERGTMRERLATVTREHAQHVLVGKVIAFINAAAKRPLMGAQHHDRSPVKSGDDGGD